MYQLGVHIYSHTQFLERTSIPWVSNLIPCGLIVIKGINGDIPGIKVFANVRLDDSRS